MFRSDAILLSKLAGCGTAIPGPGCDLSRASAAFRPLAERLLAASISERQAIWNDFLARRIGELCRTSPAQEPKPEPVQQRATLPLQPPATPPAAIAPRPAAAERGVRITCALQFEPREVEWLWSDRVPLGMITMFAGDPKLGKSFVTLVMAAAVSRGLALPRSNLPSRPASTILMSAEDDPARTIAPRLVAAGADLAKIHVIESVILANGSETLPSLRADVDTISAAAARLGDCRLIVIDPVTAYLKGVDDNRNAMVRGVLSPLRELAERLGAAVVLVSHLTKAASTNGKHRVLGSIAYVGASRANFLFLADPRDPARRRVLMFDNGGNVAPLAPPLAYTIDDQNGQGPRVVWSDEPVAVTVDEALRPRPETPARYEERELSDCEQWLQETLAGGPVLAAELRRGCAEAGFALTTLRRARLRIGAVTRREGFGPGSRYFWQSRALPNQGSISTRQLTSHASILRIAHSPDVNSMETMETSGELDASHGNHANQQ
jgi:hypothetical protein